MANLPNGVHWTRCSCKRCFPLRIRRLSKISLLEVASVLQNGMNNKFHEVIVDVARCPCLTREPFNLAGVGLSGNTSAISVGHYGRFPSDRSRRTWNIREVISSTCRDVFIIGAGYAAKPDMPYNGHLIMNAKYRAPANITNASRVVFAEASNGQRKIEMLTEPNQMVCFFMGNFFTSEGREGNVIRVRAKGRKVNTDIITIMQKILYKCFRACDGRRVVLGGVLRIKNGCVIQNVIPEIQQYPLLLTFDNVVNWFQCHDMNLESDLIAVGTLDSREKPCRSRHFRYNIMLPKRRHQFHSFSNYGAGGQFINDITKNTIEYEGYFNLAETIKWEK